MNWFSVKKDGTPNRDRRVLTYSEQYKDRPELAYRLMLGQFVKSCKDVTHYAFLKPPPTAHTIKRKRVVGCDGETL